MRVLYLNPFSQQVSGPDESLLALLARLVPLGIEPHVVLPAPGPQVERYRKAGAAVHFAPLTILRRQLSPGALATFAPRLARGAYAVARIARDVRADLVHTNMEVVLDGALAARRLRLPHVMHYRGNTLDEPRIVFDGLTWLWTRLADRVFCISRSTAEVFARRGRGTKVEVVYNPLDVAAFAGAERDRGVRAQLGAADDRQVLIGTVGRIHPRKDVETFVRAAAAVARRHPEARFVVVGVAEAPIEHTYLGRVQALARELGVADRITWAGARRDMPAVMKALDLFVLASRHEGFGRVVAEAMAAGRPMVVTQEGALPELVDGGRAGLCAAPGAPDDFASKLLSLVDDRGLAARVAEAATERARLFDAGLIAERMAGRYRELRAARGM